MKIVMFDDQRLCGRVNTKRVYGRPKFEGEYDTHRALPGLPIVFKDGTIAPYRMYYTALIDPADASPDAHSTACFCMAVSDDCVHWTPYENDLVFEGKLLPSQLVPCKECLEHLTILRDKEGVYHFYFNAVDWDTLSLIPETYVSEDGIHLTLAPEQTLHTGEPFAGSFYNHIKDCYTFIVRPAWAERRCCIVETKDFKEYSPMRVMLQVDSLDRPMTEVYGMPTFNMGDYFVGLVNLYEAPIFSSRQKFEQGHMSVQLAYSFDGVHFQRSLREQFIDRGTPETPYYGMLMPYYITERGDELIITAGATPREHGAKQKDTGSIVSFSLKKDRFIGLESDGGDAIVCTRMMSWNGGELSVNICVPYGEARVRLLNEDMTVVKGFDFDDCIPFTGDSLAWQPQWKNKKMDDLKGTYFIVEIKYYNGILYGFEGNFDMLITVMQARKSFFLGKPIPKLLY